MGNDVRGRPSHAETPTPGDTWDSNSTLEKDFLIFENNYQKTNYGYLSRVNSAPYLRLHRDKRPNKCAITKITKRKCSIVWWCRFDDGRWHVTLGTALLYLFNYVDYFLSQFNQYTCRCKRTRSWTVVYYRAWFHRL